MADTFTFELVSPEKLMLSGAAEIVTVPAVEGDMGVLSNHAPVMTSLRPGLVSVKMADGDETEYFVKGGFADITPDAVTVLAEFAIPRGELTSEMMAGQRKAAEEAMNAEKDENRKADHQSYLDQLTHFEETHL
ncbi:F0F1 ATP synthase subunit epsilon [Ahrensia sp. R2A130]|uniref:F0F1 ATP synthase subunit epsilon n=1 Tax=Ahrensia sp. R2A130 TaxID=744979 RepID=UPI0001E09458|nr:F0F1 ATP synthase subunit epsilon [Ahrensia sp. R2A130]EFL89595.1 ATP synthase F1, epsilon subunit [Ahrensia sp. R2A130]